MAMKFSYLFILSSFLMFLSCKQDKKVTEEIPTKSESTTKNIQKYKLVAFEKSTDFPDATIDGYSFKQNKFDFKISGNYELGVQTPDAPSKMCANSAKGQHIHLILNNKPYAAKYESSFDYELENGNYYMLAFLSRSYHESIKNGKAFAADFISVDNGTLTAQKKIDKEMIFYSRPKGTYVGKENTDKVMLDFYLVNTEISPQGNKVLVNINGETHFVTKWQPYEIHGLPMGENTITLTLIDENGIQIETPYNPVSRTFTLKEETLVEN